MKQVVTKITAPEGVYPPSEDTFLLADAIDLTSDDSFLEVGCGSGYIAINASMITHNAIAIDVLLDAARTTKKNAQANGIDHLTILQSHLLSGLGTSAKFSVIAFNPPYLPQDEERSDLDGALIGGDTGVEITEEFICQAVPHLAEDGSLYIVVSTLSHVDRIEMLMRAMGLEVSVIKTQRLFYEEVRVIKGTKGHKETVL
ncbi:MAG: methyltransferase [Candidatus Thorarchaeota archaeon]|nr:methyltransferase [Candidatus Thorarchaeota archaeon]